MDIGALTLPLCARVPLDERDRVTVARQALALFVSNTQGGHFCCSVILCGCQENYCASIVSNCALRDRFFCCILAVCLTLFKFVTLTLPVAGSLKLKPVCTERLAAYCEEAFC